MQAREHRREDRGTGESRDESESEQGGGRRGWASWLSAALMMTLRTRERERRLIDTCCPPPEDLRLKGGICGAALRKVYKGHEPVRYQKEGIFKTLHDLQRRGVR